MTQGLFDPVSENFILQVSLDSIKYNVLYIFLCCDILILNSIKGAYNDNW